MSLRDTFNNKPWIAVVFLILALLALFFGVRCTFCSTVERREITHDYYYNIATGKLEAVEKSEPPKLPPIMNDQGQELVQAHVWSRNDCEEDTPFILYLERYTPQGKQMVEARRQGNSDQVPMGDPNLGKEFAAPPEQPNQPIQWRDATALEIHDFMQKRMQQIPGEGNAEPCFPNP